jgi:hypothetical protein
LVDEIHVRCWLCALLQSAEGFPGKPPLNGFVSCQRFRGTYCVPVPEGLVVE